MESPPLVMAAASVLKEICYSHREDLQAGFITAGWDRKNGPQVCLSLYYTLKNHLFCPPPFIHPVLFPSLHHKQGCQSFWERRIWKIKHTWNTYFRETTEKLQISPQIRFAGNTPTPGKPLATASKHMLPLFQTPHQCPLTDTHSHTLKRHLMPWLWWGIAFNSE